jgi:hypothetical protein
MQLMHLCHQPPHKMRGLAPRANRLRAFALLSGAALTLHQLRYLLAYGEHSDEQLRLQSHAYMEVLLPFVAALVLLAVGAFVAKLFEARRTMIAESGVPNGPSLWLRSSVALLTIYTFQEWLEGAVGQGHEAGLAAGFAGGGWWAIPLALVLGALVASLLRGAATAIALVATHRSARRRDTGPFRKTRRELPSQKPALDVIASFLAGRGPPVTSI